MLKDTIKRQVNQTVQECSERNVVITAEVNGHTVMFEHSDCIGKTSIVVLNPQKVIVFQDTYSIGKEVK